MWCLINGPGKIFKILLCFKPPYVKKCTDVITFNYKPLDKLLDP